MNFSGMNIAFAPFLPPAVLAALAFACAVLLVLSLAFRWRGAWPRAVGAIILIAAAFNPALTTEERKPVPDVLAVVADFSPSQKLNDREARTKAILSQIREKLGRQEGLELRITEEQSPAFARDTRLFEAADRLFSDVPPAQRAGLILITDGQVHDRAARTYGPVHALLTGKKGEFDRRIVILSAPTYGLTGRDVFIRYRVEDTRNADHIAHVILSGADDIGTSMDIPVNTDQQIAVPLTHAGQNIFSLSIGETQGEITAINNSIPLSVNGVRDRLRVLLVSGQPYAGERTWRDLLTSDPGVDLVHFTILREPSKIDSTPQREMSLIPFPFEELFDHKLSSFDLVIFDRYRLNNIMPDRYFTNIADYVRKGGGLLEVSGPYFHGPQSVFATDLSTILPAAPAAPALRSSFTPALSETGKRHPVTRGLGDGAWGAWQQQIPTTPQGEPEILMTGAKGLPLLLLSRVEKGRVAQLTSDQIWYWARGVDGGGPHRILLQRLAHWLMKEPELEEDMLEAEMTSGGIAIRRHSLSDDPVTVALAGPDGKAQDIALEKTEPGLHEAVIPAVLPGLYRIRDGERELMVLAGDMNAQEFQSMTTTDERLLPAVRASHGSIAWDATNAPDLRPVASARNYSGPGWIGWKNSGSYVVTGASAKDLLPPWLALAVLLLAVLAAWGLEGRSRGVTTRTSEPG